MAEQQKQTKEQDINQLLKVRRENCRHCRRKEKILSGLQSMM